MKTKLLCAVLCLLIVVSVFAPNVSAKKVDFREVDWGITLYVDNITSNGLTLITNQTGDNFNPDAEFDTCYYLEVYQDGEWKIYPMLRGVVCDLQADSVLRNSSYREDINWESLYGVLPNGHYRLVREFFDTEIETDFYAEFAITEEHTCASQDQDLRCDQCYGLVEHPCVDEIGDGECDICGKLISEKVVYRVVGSADWMGMWSPGSNEGIMKETESGVYQAFFSDVSAGEYSFFITVNGEWENGFGDHPDDCYEFELAQAAAELIFTLDLRHGVALVSVGTPDPLPLTIPTSQTVYRVTGDADWLGSWQADNDLGIMTEVKTGVYRKEYKDVPAGSYALKITKNGVWDGAYGYDGQNYIFTVVQKSNITVDFCIRDDGAFIEVYGQAGWLDEEDEENPKSSDLMNLPAVFLLVSVTVVALLFRKREDIL